MRLKYYRYTCDTHIEFKTYSLCKVHGNFTNKGKLQPFGIFSVSLSAHPLRNMLKSFDYCMISHRILVIDPIISGILF